MVDLEALENSPAYAGVHHREIAAEIRRLRAIEARVEVGVVVEVVQEWQSYIDDSKTVIVSGSYSQPLPKRVRLVAESGEETK